MSTPSDSNRPVSMAASTARRVFERWWEHCGKVMPGDAHNLRMLEFFFWNLIARVDAARLREYVDRLAKKSTAAAKRVIGTFQLVFAEFGERSPASRLRIRTSPKRRTFEPVQEHQFRHILKVFGHDGRDTDNMLLILVMWHCGLSMVDACRLRWEDVDLKAAVISSNRSKTATGYRVPIDKGGLLFRLLTEMARGTPMVGAISNRNELRYKTCRSSLCRSISAACRSAGLPKYSSAHSVRRAFITRLAQAEVPELTISVMSGHSSTSSLRRYFHPSDAVLREAMQRAQEAPQPNRRYTPKVVPNGSVASQFKAKPTICDQDGTAHGGQGEPASPDAGTDDQTSGLSA